jgi:hypothetical protein
MHNLALTLYKLERHQDASILQEKVLDVYRRVLAPSDLDIGEDCFWD